MNIYVLVEGDVTEKKVYETWIRYVNPTLTPVAHPADVAANNYVIVSGQGYPQYLQRLKNALADVRNNPTFDRLVIAVDSEDKSYQEKFDQINDVVKRSRVKKDVRIVIQHFCFETWALGNTKVMRQVPVDNELKKFKVIFDVRSDDPELLPDHLADELNRSQFAYQYLRRILIDRSPKLRYSKSDPGCVIQKQYFDQVATRLNRTGHIASFQYFLDAFI
ncbi:MAG: hypothetical protein K8F53_00650 [Rhodocyclaceae bacterium]|nr:hypothetical protein [Rhodocyclaceae bacterium]